MLPNSAIEREDPRITRTRNLILSAFMELLPEKGFQPLTVQSIAERAKINRATFYAHFPDKYALLDFSIQQMFRQEIERRMLKACHYSEENLRILIVTVSEFVAHAHAHCSIAEPQFDSLVENQVIKQIQELLQFWLEQNNLAIEPKLAATAASWAIYGLVMQWINDKNKRKPTAEIFAGQILPLITIKSGEPQQATYQY